MDVLNIENISNAILHNELSIQLLNEYGDFAIRENKD
jgi:hypothetical protein